MAVRRPNWRRRMHLRAEGLRTAGVGPAGLGQGGRAERGGNRAWRVVWGNHPQGDPMHLSGSGNGGSGGRDRTQTTAPDGNGRHAAGEARCASERLRDRSRSFVAPGCSAGNGRFRMAASPGRRGRAGDGWRGPGETALTRRERRCNDAPGLRALRGNQRYHLDAASLRQRHGEV